MDRTIEAVEMLQHLPLIYLAVGLYGVHWIFSHTDQWQAFLNSLDTNGGHVVALLVILVVGYRMFQYDATAGGQLITGAEAALFMMLNARRQAGNSQRATDPVAGATATAQTTTTVTQPVADAEAQHD